MYNQILALLPPPVRLFASTSKPSSGSICIAKVDAIRQRLIKDCPQGIYFNRSKISPTMTGGTCSAVALEFAAKYKKSRSNLVDKIDILQAVCRMKEDFTSSSEEMRTRQEVYNTIEVISSNIDANKSKMQALAKYHQLEIVDSSKELDIKNLDYSEMQSHIHSLPQGILILRMIKPSTNEKREEQGHSMIYINESDFKLFFDPNTGVFHLSDATEAIFDACNRYYAQYGLNIFRFYLLGEPQTLIDTIFTAIKNILLI